MAATVGEIVIDVTADVGPLVRQMNKAEGALGGLQGAASRMGSGLNRAGGMALTFGRNMAVVAAGVAAVTGAALAFVRSSAAFGDAIGDASKAAGMSTTAFQEYRFALKEAADMSDDEFASAAARLNKTLGEARQGSAAAIKAFEAIGVSQTQLASDAFNTDKAMAAYVATMEGLKDPTIAAAVSTDLFGKAGAGMGAALSGVPGQVKSLVDQARELGIVLGPEAVEAAGEFDEKMNTLTAKFKAMSTELAIAMMPAMNKLLDLINTYVIPALGMDGLGGAVKGAADLIGIFATGAVQAFNDFQTAVGSAVDWVMAKVQVFLDMLDAVVTKAKEVGTAVADALKFDAGSAPNTFQEDFGTGGAPENNSNSFSSGSGSSASGAAIADGLVSGLNSRMAERLPEVVAAMQSVTDAAKATLGIQSPSKVFEEIGGNISAGMAQGISASQAVVSAAVATMGAGAVASSNAMVTDILGGLDTLFAGSKQAGAALALVNTMIGASQEIKKGTFGFASAARVIAQGMGFVKAIRGANKGGGGASAAVGGGAGGGAAAAAPAQQNVQTLNFTLQNDSLGIGQNLVRQIAAQLNEAQRNGSTLIRATIS